MVSISFYTPEECELNTQDDDAHLINNKKRTISVADGVGGWAMSNLDESEDTQQLVKNSVIAIEDEPKGAVDPAWVSNEACSDSTDATK